MRLRRIDDTSVLFTNLAISSIAKASITLDRKGLRSGGLTIRFWLSGSDYPRRPGDEESLDRHE